MQDRSRLHTVDFGKPAHCGRVISGRDCVGMRLPSPVDSGGKRFRSWPDNLLDQRAEKCYPLEEIRIRLGRRQRDLSSQYLEEPCGVLDVADAMDIGVLHLRRALFCG